jgi:hypothetical protein
MTPGLNFARAACAAPSKEGNASSFARNSQHAASREIGCAPLVNCSTDNAFREMVAIFSTLEFAASQNAQPVVGWQRS